MNKTVIALGFFDGVHMGHGQLLVTCRRRARELGCVPAALTFDTHPDSLVTGQAPPLINTPQDREWLLRNCYQMEQVLTLHFDRDMMHMPWRAFLTEILIGRYGAAHLVCGHDFRCGDRGEGTAELLKEAAAQLGVGCDIVPAYRIGGTVVSSTHIRWLLTDGLAQEAMRFLGHPHQLTGTVVQGQHLGRTLGIPTANLQIPHGIIVPKQGVYACRVWVGEQCWVAVTNVGTRPTVNGKTLTVEPWLLNYQGDLYGKEIRVEFYKYLRPERKFPSLEELKAEIHRNAQQAQRYFFPE